MQSNIMHKEALEQIEKKQAKAYEYIDMIYEGHDYETIAEFYEKAFNLIDDALDIAIKALT